MAGGLGQPDPPEKPAPSLSLLTAAAPPPAPPAEPSWQRNQRCQGQGDPQIGARDHCPGQSGDGRVNACVCDGMEVWASGPGAAPTRCQGIGPPHFLLLPRGASEPRSLHSGLRLLIRASERCSRLRCPKGSVLSVGGGVPLQKAAGKIRFCGGQSVSHLGSVFSLRRQNVRYTVNGQEVSMKGCSLEMQVLS